MSKILPADSAVLVVDDDADFRRAIAAQLTAEGHRVRTAPDYETALREVRANADVRLIILDHPTDNSRIDGIVSALRSADAAITIVGNSGADRREEFAAAGVRHYLQKPWRPEDLAGVLAGRIQSCISCRRPLPLRIPRPAEAGTSWVCAGCGARYYAVWDAAAPSAWRINVHPAASSA